LFFSDYVVSFALRGALVHLDFSSLPINLWVVVLEPGIAKDHALLSEARDSEEHPFRVDFVMEDYCYNLAKQLSHYLYFFSFSFLFFYLELTTQREVWESVMS